MKALLLTQIELLNSSVAYIDQKQAFFDGVLNGEIEYSSNLIDVHACTNPSSEETNAGCD